MVFENEIEKQLLLVGDPGRVRQILFNLTGNAIKFTRRGGVTISLRIDAARPGFAHCDVTDTGIGIPDEQQKKLFQLYSQGHASTTRRYGGTGLGLAISKQLVELMGGQIGMFSRLSKGSTFWFTLPITPGLLENKSEGNAETTAPPQAKSAAVPTKHLVLLAEDNEINQKLTVHLLEKLQCRVDVACNGLEAVSMSAQKTYDVIFMDCLMPKMDGWEATRRIRQAQKDGRRVPILAVSASVIEGDQDKCFIAGMDDFLPKPIDAQKLEKAFEKWVLSKGNGQAGN